MVSIIKEENKIHFLQSITSESYPETDNVDINCC